MIEAGIDYVLIQNLELKDRQVFGECISQTTGNILGIYPIMNLPVMKKYPELMLGIVIAPLKSNNESKNPILVFPINYYDDINEKEPKFIKSETFSKDKNYVSIYNDDDVEIKYNSDSIVFRAGNNYIAITKNGIYMDGKIIDKTEKETTFFKNNEIGEVAPFPLDPTFTLWPKIPTMPQELQDLINKIFGA